MKKIIFLITTFFLISYFGYTFYLGSQENNLIFSPDKEMVSTPEIPYENVDLTTSDKMQLNGWFFLNPKSKDVLLYFHGNGGNISHRLKDIDLFYHDLNLSIFIIDYRGFGRSVGIPSEVGVYQDALTAYWYLVRKKNFLSKNIIIYGQSLGGAVAIDLASTVPAKALITENTFTCAIDMAKYMYPYFPVKMVVRSKFQSIEKIKKISYPKLIIHAMQDQTVPFAHGQQLYDSAPAPKRFYAVVGANHGNNSLIAGPDYVRVLREFIQSL